MAQKQGKNTRKYGRNERKYGKKNFPHKFSESKEHRGCGPLGYYLRYIKARDSKNK